MKILYVSHNPPMPMHNGGAQRTNLILRALRTLGEVDLVIVSTDEVTNRAELQRDHGLVADFCWTRPGDRAPFRWFLRWKPKFVHRVAQTLSPRSWEYRPDPAIATYVRGLVAERKYDVVVGRYLRPTIKSGVVGTGPLSVLDVDDLDTKVFLSRLNVPGRPAWERLINRWHYRQIRRIIPAQLRKFDLIWVTNEEEARTSEELRGCAHTAYLPNIPVQVVDEPIDPSAPLPPISDLDAPPVVLFVGNFWVLPNQQGVEHFVQSVWPKIRAQEPRAIFRVVGAGLSDELKARWSQVPGVDAVGFVPELRASYASCRFAVVPLLSGAGTNIKVMEALRFGRTCVLTHFAHRGFEAALRDGEHLRVASDDDGFVAACVELLRAPAEADALALAGREAVAEHYSFERFRRTVADSIDALVTRRAAPAVVPASVPQESLA
jgi:glycosyltransferase involved in cell wall biosynthesis